MKFTSFDFVEFEAALKRRDEDSILFLKNCLISSIRNCPRFTIVDKESKKSEASLVMDILEHDYPEIFEPYQVLPDEIPFDKNNEEAWNTDYFITQTICFRRNFAKIRYKHLQAIGQSISKKQNSNFPGPQEPQTQAVRKPLPVKRILLATGAVLLVALVVTIVVITLR